jgi:hypothetical protein
MPLDRQPHCGDAIIPAQLVIIREVSGALLQLQLR